jgi:hypothetical protein
MRAFTLLSFILKKVSILLISAEEIRANVYKELLLFFFIFKNDLKRLQAKVKVEQFVKQVRCDSDWSPHHFRHFCFVVTQNYIYLRLKHK